MTAVRSIRPGLDPSKRTVLVAANTAVPTPDPAVSDAGLNLHGASFLHVYADLDTLTSVTVTPWYFSNIAEIWFEGDPITFVPGTEFALVETRGEERVFFVFDAVGGAGTLTLWAGYSFTEPGRDG